MPELPEVECVRKGLEAAMVGRTVVRAALRRRDVLSAPGDPVGGWGRQAGKDGPKPIGPKTASKLLLSNTRIESVVRRGKQAAIVAQDGRALIIKLGMSGRVRAGPHETELKHTHAMWALDDGKRVCFDDARRFGGLVACETSKDLDTIWADLGPDGLDATPRALIAALTSAAEGSVRAIKAILMDQSVIAGFGNIYTDETLFSAGVLPQRQGKNLDADDISRIVNQGRRILRKAVKAGGSTLRDYTDPQGRPGRAVALHRVYARAGQPCVTCGTELNSGTLAQRTTVWCPSCQR